MYMMAITVEAFPAAFTSVSLTGGRLLDISVPTKSGGGNARGLAAGKRSWALVTCYIASSDAVCSRSSSAHLKLLFFQFLV